VEHQTEVNGHGRRISKGANQRAERARKAALADAERALDQAVRNPAESPGRTASTEALPFRAAPHNLEAEQALLGAILLNNAAVDRVSSFLEPDHFYDPLHRQIYETASKLIAAGKLVTPVTLKTFFENHEPIDAALTVPGYLGRLAVNAATIINARDYGRTIHDLATRRGLIAICEDALNAAYDAPVDFPPKEQIDEAETRLVALREADNDGHRRRLTFASDADLETGSVRLIKDLLSSASKAAMFGVSRAAKTFLAIDMAFAIAFGRPFLGRKTTRGAVLIVPLEGRAGFKKRLKAAKLVHGDTGKMVGIMEDAGTLGPGPTAASFVSAVIANARQLERVSEHAVVLIILDTLAVALAGQDENAAATMAAVLAQMERITAATGATVLLIHHPNKANPKEMRGSGALFNGCDEVLRLDHEEGDPLRELLIVKSKDGEEGMVGTFTLSAVEIGRDEDDNPITSCTVKPSDAPSARKKPKRPSISSAAGRALNELDHLVIAGKGYVSRGHDRIPDGAFVVTLDDWRAACRRKGLSKEGGDEAEKKAFQRARGDMSRSGFVGDYDAHVWLIGDMPSATRSGAKNDR